VSDEGGAVTRGLVPGVERPTALIGIAEKGYLNLELKVTTEGGHSSMPPAQTSVGILSRALARLEDTPFPASLDGATLAMFDQLAPEMPLTLRLPLANLWLFRPLVVRTLMQRPESAALLHTTVAPTIVQAGSKANVLAPEATAILNLRLRPGDTVKQATLRVRDVVDDHRVRISTFGDAQEPSSVSDTNSPGYAALVRTIREILPADVIVGPMLMAGGTDAKYYTPWSRDVFRFTPLNITASDLKRVHGRDERLSIESLATGVRFYYQLIKNADGLAGR
jgi:carboxypeptidase PM20D1